MLLSGTGRVIVSVIAWGCGRDGHGRCSGRGTLPRDTCNGRSEAGGASLPTRQFGSGAAGAGSVSVLANTNAGIFGQRAIATVSETGCSCHSRGSVGVFGRSGVAGTTWTTR